jgi:predicted MFS family arabinose efflux permease
MDLASLGALRRTPGYPAFYSAATLARLADDMFSVATVLLVLDRTGSAALAGVTLACVTLPSVVTGPFLGAWLDLRGRRRRLMAADQTIATICLVAIALCAGHAPDFVLPVIGLLMGLTWPLSFGGFTSLIPVIVPQRLLPPANALEATSFNVALIAGPALAGAISGFWDPAGALAVEAVLTLVAGGLIFVVPRMDGVIPGRQAGEPRRSLVGVAADGLRQLAAVPALRAVTLTGALGLGGIGLLSVGFPFFAAESLGGDPSDAGYLWMAFAIGSATGAVALVRLQERFAPHRVMLVAVGTFGLLMLLWPLAGSLPVAMLVIALAGLADGPGLAATFAVRQQWAPPELLGQIFTTAVSLKVGAFALGAAAAGPVVEGVGAEGAILIAAGMQLLAVAAGWLAMKAPAGVRDAVASETAT